MTTKRFVTIIFIALTFLINTSCSSTRSATERKRDTDMDGVRNKIDKCPDTPLGTLVDSNGCPLDSDADGVADTREDWPDTAPLGSVRETSSAAAIRIDSDGDGIHDSLELTPGASPVEKRNYLAIKDIQDRKSVVEGKSVVLGGGRII